MRRSDLVQYKEKENGKISRTSQIVFGERQHLLRQTIPACSSTRAVPPVAA